MDPITLGVLGGSTVASGLMQYYNAEKARKASSDELNRIQALFEKVVPPKYDLKVWDNPALVANIPAPEFNTQAITPQDYKSVGQFVPEVSNFVKTTNPALVQATEAGKEGQAAQLGALERYKEIAKSGGLDPQAMQLQQQAQQQAQAAAQGRVASTLQEANRRGQLNSGVALAGQLEGGSAAMQNSAMMSQQAAADAYRNQLQALSNSASLGGQMQSSDWNRQAQNADIVNQFNMQTSRDYQNYQNQRAQQANQAQVMNLQNAQKISDANVANQNEANVRNQQYGNQMAQQNFQNQNLNRQNQIAVEQYKNQLQNMGFQNQLQQAQGMAGIGSMAMKNIRGNTQDQNAAIAGIGGGISSIGMYNAGQDSYNRRTDAMMGKKLSQTTPEDQSNSEEEENADTEKPSPIAGAY